MVLQLLEDINGSELTEVHDERVDPIAFELVTMSKNYEQTLKCDFDCFEVIGGEAIDVVPDDVDVFVEVEDNLWFSCMGQV